MQIIDKARYGILVVSSLLLIQACGGNGSSTNTALPVQNGVIEESVVEAPKIVAAPNLTQKQRFQKALKHLEIGESDYALAELEAYREKVPNNRTVRNLINQITTPIEDQYPDDYYAIKISYGQSLSTLAKRYLGSALEFYALAKYNGVSNPRKILVGQNIKIPKTKKAIAVWEKEQAAIAKRNEATENADAEMLSEETPSQLSNDQALITEEEIDALEEQQMAIEDELTGSADDAVDMIDDTLENASEEIEEELLTVESVEPVEVVEEITTDSIKAEIDLLASESNYTEALNKLAQLKSLDASSDANNELALDLYLGLAAQLEESTPELAAGAYTEVAEIYAQRNNELQYFEFLDKAAKLDPENVSLLSRVDSLKTELTDKYHRKASSEFRRQELDAAIAGWDKVLKIDPKHENAVVFRAQAIELKKKLEKITD